MDSGLEHPDVPVAASQRFGVGSGGKWQRAKRIGDKRQLVIAGMLGGLRQNYVKRAGCHGKGPVEVAEHEISALANQLNLPRIQRSPIMVTKHRQQDHIAQTRFWRLPINVKISRVAAGWA